MYDEKECIICLTDASANDYLELDCCKQTVHIECLTKWIKTNIKNKEEVRKCFHCKRNNDYINTIIYYTKLEEGYNTNYESDDNALIELQIHDNIINNYSCVKIFTIITKFVCFLSVITIGIIFTDENNDYNNKTLLSIPIYYII